ncbi:MAG: sigma-70 family RNA polymerase sigma factor [Pseudomonadota bacterium]
MDTDAEITGLLQQWGGGDEKAGDALAPLVYNELRIRAQRAFRSENSGHTLQPTALVNEAYAKLVNADVDWQDRAHFYALAARMMRRLLINHANSRKAERRGGDAVHVTLDRQEIPEHGNDVEMIALADALSALEQLDERKSRLIEMQYFGGLTVEEMAAVTDLSVATVGRELRFARAWLKNEILTDE